MALNRKRAELPETLSVVGELAVGAAVVLGTVNGRVIDSFRPPTNRIAMSDPTLAPSHGSTTSTSRG